MTQLSDLFDMDKFQEMKDAGFVKVQRHPDFPDELAIANYTAKAQQNYHWNLVTEQTRGLIYNPTTFEVLKRPFRKFYNWDEQRASYISESEIVTAYDKVDGSLGITYRRPDGAICVATRGSFTSDQALWATEWLQDKYGVEELDMWYAGYLYADHLTDMFEIVYPENRIVVNYDFNGLVYLATMETHTGQVSYDDGIWNGRATPELYRGRFDGLLAKGERDNAEGYVVVTDDGRRVKVKYEEYVRIHRIVTRLSKRTVWEMMGGPLGDIEDLVSRIPEEHAKWARGVALDLRARYTSIGYYLVEVQMRIADIKGADVRETRKLKALAIKDEPNVVKSCIFMLLDGRKYDQVLWDYLEPKGDATHDNDK